MAESSVEKLKRQARERREAAEAAAKAMEVSNEATNSSELDVGTTIVAASSVDGTTDRADNSITVSDPVAPELPEPTELATLSEPVVLQKSSRNHPLVREMEELEAALEQNVPGFVTLLRDIHKKLAEDPLTVTLLSLEERGTIVKGMTRHANVTITTKAIKSSSSKRKGPVSVADL